jgi:alanyl-tRNA synthetase
MMTERLYYHNAFLREFDAQVVSCERAAAGEAARFHIVLSRTAFYPTSGGQPHDTGTLGDAHVLDVFETENGTVIHVTDRELPLAPVRGAIDWPRRFDHMQQHTGQHLLSAAFLELFRMPTVSFHLGREVSTIDLEARAVVPRHLEEAERRANAVVFDDRPVSIRFANASELARMGVRKPVEREGPLRIVEIEGFDQQPCGGTHVARTGQVGAILLRKMEKVRGNWRVEFVCGQRAVAAARSDFHALAEAARRMTCGLREVPAMVARALEERQEMFRDRQKLQEQLAELEALSLLASRARLRRDGIRELVHVFEDTEPAYLRLLVAKMIAEPNVRVLAAARPAGTVIFAQSRGLAADMNALLQQVLGAAGGKGGGSHDFAQGTVPDAFSLDELLASALARLS